MSLLSESNQYRSVEYIYDSYVVIINAILMANSSWGIDMYVWHII